MATTHSALPELASALATHADAGGESTALLVNSAPLLAELKRVNRDAYARLGEQRAAVAAERTVLASAATERACLAYESEQLRARIDAVNTLDTVYEQVPLCDKAEFQAATGADETDEHTLLVRRLHHELDVRRKLEQRAKALQADAKAAADRHGAARDTLASLERSIGTLCTSTEKTTNYQRTGTP